LEVKKKSRKQKKESRAGKVFILQATNVGKPRPARNRGNHGLPRHRTTHVFALPNKLPVYAVIQYLILDSN
jgi:hypothetical protein